MLGIVPLILTVSGLYVVKDFISMIGGYFGAENAYTAGAGLRSSVRSGVKKYGEKINKGTTSAVGAFAKADAVRRAGGNAWDVTRSLGMSALSPFGSGLKGLTGIDFEANRKAVREAREKGQKEIQDRAKADTVENISRMPGTNREIIERAKTAGVEKEVAAILADRLNAAEVRRQRRDDQYIMKHNTGDSVLADLKTVKDTVDAFKDITNAKNRMNNAAEIFSNAGVDNAITSSLGLGNTTDTAAISRLSRGYTDAEIDAETDANRKLAMGEFNRAHEEWKERRSEFNESLSKAKTLSKDALKLTHAEYNDQISGSILNWHDLEGNHHTGVVNSTNISTIFQIAKDQSDDASLASLRTVVNLLENVSDSLNQRRVDIIRHDTREINRRAGNTKDSK